MGLVAAASVLTACQETKDDNPVFQKPTEFNLNTPPMALNYYELTPDGVVEFTCSQPDYGFAAVTNYSLDVSFDEDFATFKNIVPALPTQAVMSITGEQLSVAMCELAGITNADEFAAAEHVRCLYVRANASVSGVDYSAITSNSVTLPHVRYYLAIPSPGYIYVVGDFAGWKDPVEANYDYYKDYRLYESDKAIGSKVYSGVFDVPAGKAMFRFYTDLTGWDKDSFGSQADDNPLDFEMTDGYFEGSLVAGKGSFNFPAWAGGQMTITVNMAVDGNYSLTIQAGAVDTTPKSYIYMCGNISGWTEPSEDNAAKYENCRLVDNDSNGVYTGTFENLADSGDGLSYFRFYQALTGWGAAQWASPTGDNFALPLGEATTSAVGEGCFTLPAGKTYTITVDANNNTVMAVEA